MKKSKAKSSRRKLTPPLPTLIQGIEIGPMNYYPTIITIGGYVLTPIAAQALASYLTHFAAWAMQEQRKRKKK